KWPYVSDTGLPDKEESQRQVAFERAVDPLSWANDNSELVQVATGMGLKEWIYYARSRELFMERLNTRLAGHDPYPIKIEFFDDPGWEIWAGMVRDIEAKAG